MLLSICSITYNQSSFVRETLNGFIKQNIAHPYEIVIADDASTDGTQEILREFEKMYPDKVRLILQPVNIGVTKNFKCAIEACKGKYVALCEGDDYWTDPLKLSKQIQVLESDPSIAISFHRTRIVFQGQQFPFDDYNKNTRQITTFHDLIRGNYIHTPSCVYRNGLFNRYPDGLLKFKFGDWPLHLLNAQKGSIHFLNQEMAVYRVYDKGTWGTRSTIYKVENTIRFLDGAASFYDKKYWKEFRNSKRRYCRYLVKLYARDSNFIGLLKRSPSIIKWYLA